MKWIFAGASAVAACLVVFLLQADFDLSKDNLSLDDGISADGERVRERVRQTMAARNSSATKEVAGFGSVFERIPGSKGFVVSESYEAPQGAANIVIDSLRMLADQGDPEAAFDIYMKAKECREGAAGESKELQEIYAELGLPSTVGKVEGCGEIDGDIRSLERTYLGLAAENGFTYAQLIYSVDAAAILGGEQEMISDPGAVVDYKRRALRYLNQASSSGSVDAVMALGRVYDRGVLAERDPVKAYAHHYAARLAAPALVPANFLQKYESELSFANLEEGRRIGRLVHKECCL